ncbi:kinase-like protein [Hypoxylon crocopeplum]|nr:kinase-like protein [Hypoxylon crocopeplum]
MSFGRQDDDVSPMVEGIITVRDFWPGCAWQKHMKDIEVHTRESESQYFCEHPTLSRENSSSSVDNFGGDLEQRSNGQRYIQDLQYELDDKQVYGPMSKSHFLPLDNFFLLLQKPAIKRALEEALGGDEFSLDQMVDEICHEKSEHSRRMIFATLIYSNQVKDITFFITNKIHDADLPLRRCRFRRPGKTLQFYRRDDAEDSLTLSNLPKHWSLSHLDALCLGQYQFLIPFFDMSPGPVRFYKFEDKNIRLPFIKWNEPKASQRGGNGIVRTARIHPAHHNYEPLDGNPDVAVKEIFADFKEYRDEIQALKRFSGHQLGHAHLIRLLMALQYDGRYFLVFPLAHGNLVDLWRQKVMSPTTPQHVEWVLEQCLGMTDGLRNVHHHQPSWIDNRKPLGKEASLNYKDRGIHGDIKPENILFFSTREGNYRLVISDFGLARFHSALSVSNIAPERVSGLSLTYRPPEFDMRLPISPAYDVWSLGCVFLEFISWLLVGYDKTRWIFKEARRKDDDPSPGRVTEDALDQKDKFFNIIDGRPVVKPSVTVWINQLRALDTCNPSIKAFLNLIEGRLLQPDHSRRCRIKESYTVLKKISENYKNYLRFTQNGNVNSTPAVFDENYSVIGQLRKPRPSRRDQDGSQNELAAKILVQEQIDTAARKNSGSQSNIKRSLAESHSTKRIWSIATRTCYKDANYGTSYD